MRRWWLASRQCQGRRLVPRCGKWAYKATKRQALLGISRRVYAQPSPCSAPFADAGLSFSNPLHQPRAETRLCCSATYCTCSNNLRTSRSGSQASESIHLSLPAWADDMRGEPPMLRIALHTLEEARSTLNCLTRRFAPEALTVNRAVDQMRAQCDRQAG